MSPNGDAPLDAEAIARADVIFFTEAAQLSKANRQFGPSLRGKRTVVLAIVDEYEYMDDGLVRLLWEKVPRSVPRLRESAGE